MENDAEGQISLLKCKICTEHMLPSSIQLQLFQAVCPFPFLFSMEIFSFI